MAYTTKPLVGNYVVFVRTTPTQWATVQADNRDRNTLYFVAEAGAAKGSLWLGNTLISDGTYEPITRLDQLNDVLIANSIPTNAILMHKTVNGETGWYPTALSDVFSLMVDVFTGATETANGTSGLVPVPTTADRDLFLKGDGTWASPTAALEVTVGGLVEDVSGLSTTVSTILGNDAGTGLSMRAIAQAEAKSAATSEVAKVVADAPEAFDTLKEIADWITDNKAVENYVELENRVGNLEKALNGTPEEKDAESGEVITPAVKGLTTVVSELVTTVGDSTSGLVKTVSDLSTTVSGLEGQMTNLTVNTIPGINTKITNIESDISEIDQRLCWHELTEEEITE